MNTIPHVFCGGYGVHTILQIIMNSTKRRKIIFFEIFLKFFEKSLDITITI